MNKICQGGVLLVCHGSSGTGKSYIATALGYRVCQKGLKVLYANTSRLLGQLKATKVKGSIL